MSSAHLSAVRFRFYQQHSDIQWGVENFYIGPACDGHCGGHGDCLDQRCLCDPGFTGPNCYASAALKVCPSLDDEMSQNQICGRCSGLHICPCLSPSRHP